MGSSFKLNIFVVGLLLASISTSMAAMVATPLKSDGNEFGYKVEAELGVAHNKAKEYVFIEDVDTPSGEYSGKLSQLDWDSDGVLLVGVSGSLRWNSLSLNLGLWTGVDESDDDGNMRDQDWAPPSPEFYEDFGFSYSVTDSECNLVSSIIFDANLSYEIKLTDDFTIFPMLGFHYENWEWEANGSVGYDGFPEYGLIDYIYIPSFVNVISYEQEYMYAYIGLNASYTYKNFVLSGYVNYAPGYKAKDKDDHKMREILFENDFDYDGDVVSLGVSGTYFFDKNMYVAVSYDFMKTSTERTVGTTTSYENGIRLVEDGDDDTPAGVDISTSVISIKIGATF